MTDTMGKAAITLLVLYLTSISISAVRSTSLPPSTPSARVTCMTEYLMTSLDLSLDTASRYEYVLARFSPPLDQSTASSVDQYLISVVLAQHSDATAAFLGCLSGQHKICKSSHPCGTSGKCLRADIGSSDVTDYRCVCQSGFSGFRCQTALSPCLSSSPCRNGGTCLDQPLSSLGYTCNCRELYTGVKCEQSILQNITSLLVHLAARLEDVERMSAVKSQETTDAIASVLEKIELKTDQALERMSTQVNQSLNCRPEAVSKIYTSCKHVKQDQPGACSGVYKIATWHPGHKVMQDVFCDMSRRGGGWTRIAQVDAAEEGACPGALQIKQRSCARPLSSQGSCASATFPAIPGLYSEVMGYVTGIWMDSVDAFRYHGQRSIDAAYADGVSVTYGRPRKHIWTYTMDAFSPCPCSLAERERYPAFTGGYFYCHSVRTQHPKRFGNGACSPRAGIHYGNQPAWFHRRLPAATSSSIEVRACADSSSANEDVLIKRFELYVR